MNGCRQSAGIDARAQLRDRPPSPLKKAAARRKARCSLFVPTAAERQMVQGMAAVGVRQDLICTQIRNRATASPIDRKTLRRAFRAELTAGMIEATQAVISALFENAVVRHNVTAQIFWLKNRAPNEWRDRTERVHGGEFRTAITIAQCSPEAEI